MREKTITEFTYQLIELYEIEDNKNNFKSIRKRLERELKNKGYWDSAKEIKIGRNISKVFDNSILELIQVNIEPYLLKKSSINTEELSLYRHQVEEYIDYSRNNTDEIQNIEEEINNNPSFEMSENEQLKLMIKALFNLYFEPIDVEQYKKDNTLIQTAEDFDQLNIECFNAYKRLSNPIKSYIKKRKHI